MSRAESRVFKHVGVPERILRSPSGLGDMDPYLDFQSVANIKIDFGNQTAVNCEMYL